MKILKKELLLGALLSVFLLTTSTADAVILKIQFYPTTEYFDDGLVGDTNFHMQIAVWNDNSTDTISLEGQAITGRVDLIYRPAYDGLAGPGSHLYVDRFNDPVPGPSWAGNYFFYVNDVLVATQVLPDSIRQIDPVGNPRVNGGLYPTTTCEGVSNANHYNIHLVTPNPDDTVDTENLLYFSGNLYVPGCDQYFHIYEGDLFTLAGNEILVVQITAAEAQSLNAQASFWNRSRYFLKHIPADIDGDGDVDSYDLAIFAARFGK